MSNFWRHWAIRVDGMIHPQAAADPFSAPLHRSFLTGCFLSGTIALFVLPLHLALAGAPHAATILVLAWMLSQWPLALYLSQSGALNRAIGMSSVLFACFVTVVCVLTGGSSSFAFIWLLIAPIEAAFASDRRIAVGVTALCAVFFSAITFLNPVVSHVSAVPPEVKFTASIAALLYIGLIGYRISGDRKLAQNAVTASHAKRRLINQNVSDVLCELGSDGQFTVLGGPIKQLLGTMPPATGEDWLFPRLHVGDRPLYLTKLSEARHNAHSSDFQVRLRTGASAPGESGQAGYREVAISFRPIREEDSSRAAESRMLVVLRERDGAGLIGVPKTQDVLDPRVAKVSWTLVENAGEEARAALSALQDCAVRLEVSGAASVDTVRDTARQLRSSCETGMVSVNSILDLVPESETLSNRAYNSAEIGSCLDQCHKLLRPIADEVGVSIELEPGQDWPRTTVDRSLLRQSMCFILSDMIETTGNGAVIHVSGQMVQSEFQLTISVKNRHSSLSWSSTESGPVLEFAAGLLERSGARLSVQTTLGQGESVVVCLPVRTAWSAQAETAELVDLVQPAAKTA